MLNGIKGNIKFPTGKEGFEPPTYALEVRYSDPLNYLPLLTLLL